MNLTRVHQRFSRVVLPLLLIIVASVASGCTYLFFKPSKEFVTSPEVRKYSPLDVYFKSSDGLTLHGWYFRAREERGTILICHGNVENLSTHAKLDLWLIDGGYNVFIFDYRGYGRSEGAPDVQGINGDAEAALETLLFTLPREKHDAITVFGKSLGGAVAVYMTAHSPFKDQVKTLILDSVFSSYRMIAREKVAESVIGWPFQYPLSFLVNDDYSPVKFIRNIAPIPIVIIHGNHDEVVPEHHGRILYDAALQPKEFWELTIPGHVMAQVDENTRGKILNYLARLP
jgi:fermentation-respiration switch protein FrsA (DUF1100 family)